MGPMRTTSETMRSPSILFVRVSFEIALEVLVDGPCPRTRLTLDVLEGIRALLACIIFRFSAAKRSWSVVVTGVIEGVEVVTGLIEGVDLIDDTEEGMGTNGTFPVSSIDASVEETSDGSVVNEPPR